VYGEEKKGFLKLQKSPARVKFAAFLVILGEVYGLERFLIFPGQAAGR
jgi:hypothetical protein